MKDADKPTATPPIAILSLELACSYLGLSFQGSMAGKVEGSVEDCPDDRESDGFVLRDQNFLAIKVVTASLVASERLKIDRGPEK